MMGFAVGHSHCTARNSVQSYEQAALGHRFTADDARASSYELIDFENDSELDSQEVIWSAEVNRGQGGECAVADSQHKKCHQPGALGLVEVNHVCRLLELI